MSPTRKPIAKCLGRNYKRTFVKHSLKSPGILKHFLLRIYKVIRKEMSQVLHDTTFTVKKAQRENLTARYHGRVNTLHCSRVLVGFLDACIPKNSSKRESTIMTCIGILVKSHNRNTLLHLFTSLVLSAGHAGKQVCAFTVFTNSSSIS